MPMHSIERFRCNILFLLATKNAHKTQENGAIDSLIYLIDIEVINDRPGIQLYLNSNKFGSLPKRKIIFSETWNGQLWVPRPAKVILDSEGPKFTFLQEFCQITMWNKLNFQQFTDVTDECKGLGTYVWACLPWHQITQRPQVWLQIQKFFSTYLKFASSVY